MSVKICLTEPQQTTARAVLAWCRTDSEFDGLDVQIVTVGATEAARDEWQRLARACEIYATFGTRTKAAAADAERLADYIGGRLRAEPPEQTFEVVGKRGQMSLFGDE